MSGLLSEDGGMRDGAGSMAGNTSSGL
jgi:hypothetical protein